MPIGEVVRWNVALCGQVRLFSDPSFPTFKPVFGPLLYFSWSFLKLKFRKYPAIHSNYS